MKISLSWLSDHIKISPNVDIQKISESLTNLGLEVENVYNPSLALKDFIIAKIIEVTKHPNADRLTLCKVDVGNNVCDVVCGANNVRENLKVVFAPIGSVIPSTGQVLKKKEIRGVVGEGMLCSEKELALGDNHEGILELSNDAPVGELYYEWAGISDYILDIAITPNRGDCASVLGIARELSSLELGKLINKNFPTIKGNYKSPINWKIDLDNSNKYLVPYVKGRYFRGLKNTTSPEWLQKKLFSVGLKPISALVDLTNFITLDIGRPLHVFDCKKIKGNLIMRMAKTGESLLCLDGNKYNLNNKNLIISDEKGPQSIAGVMGGMESGCTFDTTEMFLESAIFDKNIVAYNGRSMNILSDARYRFERGIDHKSADYGLEYMTKLVLDICGGEASDVVSDGSNAIKKNHINFRTAQVKKIGGIEISKNLQTKIFKKLGFNIKEKSNTIKVEVPSWRHDINEEVDLIEELMRVNGYEKIKNQPLDENNIFNHTTISLAEQRMRIARDVLARR